MTRQAVRWGLVLGGAILAATVGAVLAARLLDLPDAARLTAPDTSAGLRAQHGLAEVLMRAGGLSTRTGPVEMTTAELNALLARHVETRRLNLRPLRVHAEEGALEVAGRTTLRQMASGAALGRLAGWLPDAVLDLGLWVSVTGRLAFRPGEGEFVVERAAMGRQRVPPGWLWRLLDIDPREHLAWRMPRIVERIEVQRDRLLIHTRPRAD